MKYCYSTATIAIYFLFTFLWMDLFIIASQDDMQYDTDLLDDAQKEKLTINDLQGSWINSQDRFFTVRGMEGQKMNGEVDFTIKETDTEFQIGPLILNKNSNNFIWKFNNKNDTWHKIEETKLKNATNEIREKIYKNQNIISAKVGQLINGGDVVYELQQGDQFKIIKHKILPDTGGRLNDETNYVKIIAIMMKSTEKFDTEKFAFFELERTFENYFEKVIPENERITQLTDNDTTQDVPQKDKIQEQNRTERDYKCSNYCSIL